MCSFEFALTLASGFAPPAPAGAVDGCEAERLERTPHTGHREAQIDLFECDLLECREANPGRLATVNCGS